MRLKNKIALVTGAAQGIGEAVCRLFYEQGAVVIVSDIQEKRGRSIVSEMGERADFIQLDVGKEEDWQKAYGYITEKYGRLDVLVNNAGIAGFLEAKGPFDPENINADAWDMVHRVNLTGTMFGCKYGIKLMKDRGGSIVNISSRSGIVGIPGSVAYASSKAGVRNHTKSVALYCAEKGYNIRCNSLHPAAIMTPMWDVMLGKDAQREAVIKQIESGIPLGHFGAPNDVAYAVIYLASDESRYVTGAELNIDGGILAGSEAKPQKK